MFNKKFLFVFLFVFLFLMPMVYSKQLDYNLISEEGLSVEPVLTSAIRTGEDYEFELHVFNKTNGIPITDKIICYMHLYHKDGTHEYEGTDAVVSHDFDYSFDVDGANFTSRGSYQAKFQCDDNNQGTITMGGASELTFFVNDYGELLTPEITSSHNQSMWFLMILFILSLIGVFAIENPTGKLVTYLSAHVIFIAGTFSEWQFLQGYATSYIVNAGIFKTLFYVSIISFFPMVILSMVWIFYIHLMNDTIKGFMDRGMDEDSAYRKAGGKR